MKLAWLWLDSSSRFVQVEDLTTEEKLLRTVTAADYGPDIESAWESCSRIAYEAVMERRRLASENDPGDLEAGF